MEDIYIYIYQRMFRACSFVVVCLGFFFVIDERRRRGKSAHTSRTANTTFENFNGETVPCRTRDLFATLSGVQLRAKASRFRDLAARDARPASSRSIRENLSYRELRFAYVCMCCILI